MTVPSIGMMALAFAPFFFIQYSNNVEWAFKPYIPVILIAAAGTVIAAGPGIIYILSGIIPGLVAVIMHRKGETATWKTVLLPALPAGLVFLSVLLIFPGFAAELRNGASEAIAQIYTMIQQQNGTAHFESNIYPLYEQRDMYAKFFIGVAPAVATSVLIIVMYFTNKIFFRTAYNQILDMPEKLLVLPVAGGLILVYFFSFFASPGTVVLSDVQINIISAGIALLMISGAMYFCRGFDIVNYYFSRWRLLGFTRILLLFLILAYPPLQFSIAVLGLISVFLNLIKEDKEKDGTAA